MKNQLLLLFVLISFPCLVCGQTFVESKEFELTQYDTGLFEEMMTSNGAMDGNTEIYVIDQDANRLQAINVYIESYDNDAGVEEWNTTTLEGIRKIVRVLINQCACYCNTSKYYWLITHDNRFIALPVIEQEDYELSLKTIDYEFNNDSNVIEMVEFQDDMVRKNQNDVPTFNLKSKGVIQSYKWDGAALTMQ